MSAITMAGLSASDAEEAEHLQIRFFLTLNEDTDLVTAKLEEWAIQRGLDVN
jgi:hypothetical protein